MLGRGVQLEDPTESVSLDKARTLAKKGVNKHNFSGHKDIYDQKKYTKFGMAKSLC